MLPGARKDILLSHYTTYNIGGSADWFFDAATDNALIKAVRAAKN